MALEIKLNFSKGATKGATKGALKDAAGGVAGGATLALWRIDESIEELMEGASEWQREYARGLSDKRQIEWLGWQRLLREVVGAGLRTSYRESGAPYIIDDSRYLSVSHCSGYAAIVLSDRPCGVDIELCGRDFSRVANRILSPSERKFSDRLATVWGAKEAIYKALQGVDLVMLTDIVVDSIEEESVTAHVGREKFELRELKYNGVNVVYFSR